MSALATLAFEGRREAFSRGADGGVADSRAGARRRYALKALGRRNGAMPVYADPSCATRRTATVTGASISGTTLMMSSRLRPVICPRGLAGRHRLGREVKLPAGFNRAELGLKDAQARNVNAQQQRPGCVVRMAVRCRMPFSAVGSSRRMTCRGGRSGL